MACYLLAMRRALIPVVLLLAASAGPVDERPADLEQALTWLAEPGAPRREAGERWLALHLATPDYARLARAAREGGPEVGRRLVAALGSDDRHLELAALLAAERDPGLAALGEAALGERIAAWSTSLDDEPLPRRRLPEPWGERSERPFLLDPDAGDLDQVLDRLERLGGGPAPLVLDPGLDPEVRAPRAGSDPLLRDEEPVNELSGSDGARRVGGSWIRALEGLVRARRVTFEVLGHREDPEPEDDQERGPSARAWVRVGARGDLGRGTTRSLLVEWCREVARPEAAESRRTACARALASTGWAGGLAWLESRWVARGDRAAREGLLHAAARGRVAPALMDAGRVRDLLAGLDRAELAGAAPGGPDEQRLRRRAEVLGRALAEVGPTGVRGERLAPALLDGWSAAGPLGRWVRLVALEGHGALDDAGREALLALLARPGSVAMRLQALRVLARAGGGGAVELAAPARLLTLAAGRGQGGELAALLVDAGVPVPAGPWWREASLDEGSVQVLVSWALARGEEGLARHALTALLARAGGARDLEEQLAPWRAEGQGERLARLLEDLAADPDPGLARRSWRLSLALGLARPGAARERLDDLLGRGAGDAGDLLDLAVLAAHPELGWRAREALAAAFARPGVEVEALARACTEAARELLRQRQDDLAEAFRVRLAGAASRADHPLAPLLLDPGWPELPGRPPRRLELEDRRLAPGEPG